MDEEEASAKAAAKEQSKTAPTFVESFSTCLDAVKYESTLSSFNGTVLDLTFDGAQIVEVPATLVEAAPNLQEIKLTEDNNSTMCRSDLSLLKAGDLTAFLEMLKAKRAERKAQYAALDEAKRYELCDAMRQSCVTEHGVFDEEEKEQKFRFDSVRGILSGDTTTLTLKGASVYQQLTTLPDAVCQLKTLRVLNVSENEIEVLPASIGELVNLEMLYATNNLLSELPDALLTLKQLSFLDLSFNSSLETLPDGLDELPNLLDCILMGCECEDDWEPKFLKMKEGREERTGVTGSCTRKGKAAGSGSKAAGKQPVANLKPVFVAGQGWRLRKDAATLEVDATCTVLDLHDQVKEFKQVPEGAQQKWAHDDMSKKLVSAIAETAKAGGLVGVEKLILNGGNNRGPWLEDFCPGADDALPQLLEALKDGACPALQHLSLHSARLGDDGAVALADVISTGACGSLRHIGIIANNIGDEGARALIGALDASASVEKMEFDGNDFEMDTSDDNDADDEMRRAVEESAKRKREGGGPTKAGASAKRPKVKAPVTQEPKVLMADGRPWMAGFHRHWSKNAYKGPYKMIGDSRYTLDDKWINPSSGQAQSDCSNDY